MYLDCKIILKYDHYILYYYSVVHGHVVHIKSTAHDGISYLK